MERQVLIRAGIAIIIILTLAMWISRPQQEIVLFGEKTYVVATGDTLTSIAKKQPHVGKEIPVDEFVHLVITGNDLTGAREKIYPGQTLIIPVYDIKPSQAEALKGN